MISKSNRHNEIKTILINVKQEIKETFSSQNMTNHPLYYEQLTIILFKALKYTNQFLQLINSDESIGCIIDEIVRRLNQSYQQYKSQNVFADSVISFNEKDEKNEDDQIYHFMNTRNSGLPMDCISTYSNDKQRKELLQFVQSLQHKRNILSKQTKRSLIVPKSNIKVQRKATFDPLITSYQDKKVQSLKVSSEDIFEEQKDRENYTTENKQCFSIKESLMQSQSNISQSKSKMKTQILDSPVEQMITKAVITQVMLNSKNQIVDNIMRNNNKQVNITKKSSNKKNKVKNKQQIKKTNENKFILKNTKSLNQQAIKIGNLNQQRFKSEDCSLKIIKTSKTINDKKHTAMITNIKLQSKVLEISMNSLLFDDSMRGIKINIKKQCQKNQSNQLLQASSTNIHQIDFQQSVDASVNQTQFPMLTKDIHFEDKVFQQIPQKISPNKEQFLHKSQQIEINLKDKSNVVIPCDETYKNDKMLRVNATNWQGSDAAIHINSSQKQKNRQDIDSFNQIQNKEIVSSLIPKKVLRSKISLLNFQNSKQQEIAKAQQLIFNYGNEVNQTNSQHSSHLKSRMSKNHQISSLNNSINMVNKNGNQSNGRKNQRRQAKESVLRKYPIDKLAINKISNNLMDSNGDKNHIHSNQMIKIEQNGQRILAIKTNSIPHHPPQINEFKGIDQIEFFSKYYCNSQNLKKMQMHSRGHKSVEELSFHRQQFQDNTLNYNNACDKSYKNDLKYANKKNNQIHLMEDDGQKQSQVYHKLCNNLSSNKTTSFSPHQIIKTPNIRSFYNKRSSPELHRSNEMFELSTQFRMRKRRQKMKEYLQLIEMTHNKFCGEKCVHVTNLFKKEGGMEQKLSEQLIRLMMMKK